MENGWYHVMNRGIDARRLFPDNEANEHFRELLARMPTRFGLRIHAYVLMGNHYHLQIETLRPNLSRAIQWLNLSFSLSIDFIHELFGIEPLQSFRATYRRQLEEMAALGNGKTAGRSQ